MSTLNKQAETLARMSTDERDNFVESIVTRYPNLADELMSSIGYALLEQDIGEDNEIWSNKI